MQAFLFTTIIIISLFRSIISHHPGSDTDQASLLDIKSKISHDPYNLLSSWNKSLPLCKWQGITCGRRHKRVVGLDLSSNALFGTLSPSIGNLSFLHNLMLHNNTFQGVIPPEITHLSRLRVLSLSNNSFEGEIPANLSRCVHLTRLLLGYNKLMGRIPIELSSLPNLKWFRLSYNNLSGDLSEIGITNMTSLEKLTLEGNHLEGEIPNDIGNLKGLITLFLGENGLSGMIPPSLFNLSSLKYLYLGSSGIHGKLPHDLGLLLPNLKFLHISNNYLSGSVPKSLSNLSELVQIDISKNNFTGKFLFSGMNLQNLQWLSMDSAFTSGDKTNDLSFIETLTNCSNLEFLEVGINDFGGILPNAIVNLSTNLRFIDLHSNRLTGSLPSGMGKFVNLNYLLLHDNQFIGPIPTEIGELRNLETAFFAFNNFSGNIPSSLGNLSFLSDLRINNNNLVGNIPLSLGRCKYLLRLYLSGNNISGVLPQELFYASELIELVIGENHLQGSLPTEISNLKNLINLDVSENMFSGDIPSTIGSCTSLVVLYMGANSFSGSFPLSLSSLKSIQELDLSQNNLSGQIPSYLSDLPLTFLGLSFNDFESEVPTKGIFANTSAFSLGGNKKLCGGVAELHFIKCPSQMVSKRRKRKVSFKMVKIIISSVLAGLLIIALVLALVFCFLCSKRKMKSTSSGSLELKGFLEAPYRMLWEETQGFSPSNLIGIGGFGSVYKGLITRGEEEMQVAIKVLNLENERANKSLIAECKALRNIRHRNLVKIITYCSSLDYKGNDFKALVYEFMPRGSLDSWLHSAELIGVSLIQRLSIVIDVACALDYLHNECPTPIIHCDLKPSNILLDDEMTAHVGDFGLAKFLLGSGSQTSTSQVRGTIGYTAPEYGIGSKASAEGDIYNFGILVLETMTSKKPTDPEFNGLNLRDFVESVLPDRVMEIVDPRLVDDGRMRLARNGGDIWKMECIKLLINIGIQCSLELPQERMNIRDVVNQLKLAKQNFLGRRI